MEKLYIVVKQGVYRHSIVGASPDFHEARSIASEAITKEEDGYHDFIIGELEINKRVEDIKIIGKFTRQDEFEEHSRTGRYSIKWESINYGNIKS